MFEKSLVCLTVGEVRNGSVRGFLIFVNGSESGTSRACIYLVVMAGFLGGLSFEIVSEPLS